MTEYRAYVANHLLDQHTVELWSGTRLVARLQTTEKTNGEAVTHEIKEGRMVPKNMK